MQDLHNSTSRGRTFLVSCQKPPDICHHVQRPIEKTEKKNTRTAAGTIASLQRVKESRRQLQTGAKGRSVRPRRRETSSRQTRSTILSKKSDKEGVKFFRETMNIMAKQRENQNAWHSNVKAPVDTTWQIFATLPTAIVKVTRT